MGFPVRVIATSDIDLCWSAFRAILGDDRMAVGREAILAELRIARRLCVVFNGQVDVVGGGLRAGS